MKGLNLVAVVLALWAGVVQAANFTVSDIRIEGLQQVEPGIVFRNFPISRGNQVDDQRLNDATRDLFETGYFDDVQLLRDDGDVLVLRVVERPAISLIRIEGNDFIKEEQLRDALKRGGVEEGDIFRRSSLELIRLELLKVYNEAGRYTASIDTEIEEGDGNRVIVDVKIKEGRIAVVKQINIVGNKAFDDETLLDLFDTGLTNMWSWWTDNDKYAREKVSADIERVKSWYLDRGYAQFEINSTDVSVSPDQKQVYINLSITEGPLIRISEVGIVGKVPETMAGFEARLAIVPGDLYSRKSVTEAQQTIVNELGKSGYFYTKVTPLSEPDGDQTVKINFFVEPGKLTYIRRIQISGNSSTADEVIRREVPQMEGALLNADLISKARQRIDRLGFFKSVKLETVPVAGSDDLVDIQIGVEEQLLGQLTAGVGVSDSEGVGFQFGIQQDNFLGTGNRLGFEVNTSSVQTTYSASFYDPYYTLDGVSRGYNFYYRTRDFQEDDISDYNTNEMGAAIEFGYPLNESDKVRLSLGADVTEVQLRSNTGSTVVERFVGNSALSADYLTYELGLGWNSNTLNSGFFPTKGYSQDLSLRVAIPGGDLSYYRAEYRGKYYRPLSKNEDWALGFRAYGGYADSLDDNDYPFYKNFFAGGRRTVRGYSNNSLGPRESNGDVVGGNMLISGSSELIVPTPFTGDVNQWRTSLFLDIGNVFRTDCDGLPQCTEGFDSGELRASAGIALGWLTPIGPLAISYGKALNSKAGDEEQQVQFVIGSTF